MTATPDHDGASSAPGCFQCRKQEGTSWVQHQALRHHHLLRDFPTRQRLQEHLRQESLDVDTLHSTLAWRDGIAEAWGHTFVWEDGTYMPLYEAWVHGSQLMRGKVAHTPAVPPWVQTVEDVDEVEQEFDEVVPF